MPQKNYKLVDVMSLEDPLISNWSYEYYLKNSYDLLIGIWTMGQKSRKIFLTMKSGELLAYELYIESIESRPRKTEEKWDLISPGRAFLPRISFPFAFCWILLASLNRASVPTPMLCYAVKIYKKCINILFALLKKLRFKLRSQSRLTEIGK